MVLTRQEAKEVGHPRAPPCSRPCAANPEDPRSLPSGLLFLAPQPHSTLQARDWWVLLSAPQPQAGLDCLLLSSPTPLGCGGRGLERDGESEELRWRSIVVNTVYTAQGPHGQFHWPVPPVRLPNGKKQIEQGRNGL